MFNKSAIKECQSKLRIFLIFLWSLNVSHFYFQIVLIDEGTSNLDNETELAINFAIKNAFKTSTVLIIAHRLNGLQNTDRICILKSI
jgi:ABC-type uncharacterized transport system ATPase subunit